MEAKAKWNLGAPLIIGGVFSFVGAVFFLIGVLLRIYSLDPDAGLISLVFIPLGAVFLVLGIVFLAATVSKKRQQDRLIAAGRYIWGEVTEFVPNYSVQVNGRHPRIALVRYEDANGIHIFRSRNLYRYPDSSAAGRKVKVYIGSDRYDPYYVDIDPVLPRVIEH